MSSNKLGRTNEDIQRVLATLIRNVKDPRVNQGMLSVTAVDTTGDLRYSKVYLSVMGLRSEKELMKGLKSASGYLRRELGNSLQLRYTPELLFHLDKSIEHGARISTILSGLETAQESSGAGEADGGEGDNEDADEQY
ncbi:MAG: 30S ribosome-binding factor RbfA [Clostridiales bacterium]|nr:30S ribosome-binding factor RbfA [Clostridiales bacterium]